MFKKKFSLNDTKVTISLTTLIKAHLLILRAFFENKSWDTTCNVLAELAEFTKLPTTSSFAKKLPTLAAGTIWKDRIEHYSTTTKKIDVGSIINFTADATPIEGVRPGDKICLTIESILKGRNKEGEIIRVEFNDGHSFIGTEEEFLSCVCAVILE
jgi:hypothetical protein